MMRRVILALFAAALFVSPVFAAQQELAEETFGAEELEQALESQTRQALSGVSPTKAGSFGKALWKIVSEAFSGGASFFRAAVFTAGKVLAAAMLCTFAGGVPDDPGREKPAQIAGAFAITALCTRDTAAMLGLARETALQISDYTSLLLPVLSSALAASGAGVSAGTLLAGGCFAMSVLTRAACGVLLPLVSVYILLATAEAASDGGMLEKLRALSGQALTLLIKGLCAGFTAYLSLSRILTGPADEASVKAAQAALSGMVPVVGSILSDASETLLAGAGLIRSAAGAFGMLAVISMALAPFLRLGAFYLALRLAGAIGGDTVSKAHAELIANLASAMGYMLAITASMLWMSLVSTACFIKVVSG